MISYLEPDSDLLRKSRCAQRFMDHSLDRLCTSKGCSSTSTLPSSSLQKSKVPIRKLSLSIDANYRIRRITKEREVVERQRRRQDTTFRSPMNTELHQEQYRGNCNNIRKRQHCDGTSPKENLQTFRTSSDLSGDHGWVSLMILRDYLF